MADRGAEFGEISFAASIVLITGTRSSALGGAAGRGTVSAELGTTFRRSKSELLLIGPGPAGASGGKGGSSMTLT